jgi:hypothetical protein
VADSRARCEASPGDDAALSEAIESVYTDPAAAAYRRGRAVSEQRERPHAEERFVPLPDRLGEPLADCELTCEDIGILYVLIRAERRSGRARFMLRGLAHATGWQRHERALVRRLERLRKLGYISFESRQGKRTPYEFLVTEGAVEGLRLRHDLDTRDRSDVEVTSTPRPPETSTRTSTRSQSESAENPHRCSGPEPQQPRHQPPQDPPLQPRQGSPRDPLTSRALMDRETMVVGTTGPEIGSAGEPSSGVPLRRRPPGRTDAMLEGEGDWRAFDEGPVARRIRRAGSRR